MSVGERIRTARKQKGLTQESLAKMIGRTKGSIANYENGVSFPSVDDMSALMRALDVDANYIYDWEKTKPATNGDELSDKEYKIALAYRTASEDDKAVVDVVLKKYMNPSESTGEKAI